jgi:multiple sugar transport system permease protein
MIMYLNNHMYSKNYGMAGAVSTVLFILCSVLCFLVYVNMTRDNDSGEKRKRGARH